MVLVDPPRSASPPNSHGIRAASAVMTLLPAARVATGLLPGDADGRSASQPGGSSPLIARSSCAATSGYAARYAASLASHAAWASAPRLPPSARWTRTSSGTKNCASGSQPSAFLVAATSASPSGEPCAALVPAFLGEP